MNMFAHKPDKGMIFVDGSNLLIEMSKKLEIPFRADYPPTSSIAFAQRLCSQAVAMRSMRPIRMYWFASYRGGEEYNESYSETLRSFSFEPMLFKQKKGGKEKGVDIALTKEMLINAFNQNYDHAILIAGDEDYHGLVGEVKRYGPTVDGAFFQNGLSKKLKLSFDQFVQFEEPLPGDWNSTKDAIREELSNQPNKSSKKDAPAVKSAASAGPTTLRSVVRLLGRYASDCPTTCRHFHVVMSPIYPQ